MHSWNFECLPLRIRQSSSTIIIFVLKFKQNTVVWMAAVVTVLSGTSEPTVCLGYFDLWMAIISFSAVAIYTGVHVCVCVCVCVPFQDDCYVHALSIYYIIM